MINADRFAWTSGGMLLGVLLMWWWARRHPDKLRLPRFRPVQIVVLIACVELLALAYSLRGFTVATLVVWLAVAVAVFYGASYLRKR